MAPQSTSATLGHVLQVEGTLKKKIVLFFLANAALAWTVVWVTSAFAATSPTDIVLGGQTVAVGDTLTVPVALQAPEGVVGYSAVVSVSDPTILSITGLRIRAYLGVSDIRESRIEVSVTDLANVWKPGDSVAELMQVDVRGEAVGQAFVTVDMMKLDDDAGTALPLSSDSLLVTVQ